MRVLILYVVSLVLVYSATAQEKKLTLSGYSELRISSAFGEPVDEASAERFEASGGEEERIEKGSHIYFPGFNLNLLSEISPKIYFQGELNFEYFEGELNVSLFRSYIDYRANDMFNVQVGKFLSPIGYLNRNQRIYGYLNYSVKPREMVWEEFGYMPSFMLGLQTYGSFVTNSASFNYRLAYGQMRESVSFGREISFASMGKEGSHSPGIAGELEVNMPTGDGEILIGMSAYSNPNIASVFVVEGEETEEDNPLNIMLPLRETGISPYLRFDFPKFQFFGELHSSKFDDKNNITSRSSYSYIATSIELLYKTEILKKGFYPYVRYDFRKVDDNHPYYGLLMKEGFLHKEYVFNSSEIILGSALDIVPGNRIKFEAGRFLMGPNPGYRIAVSTSFAF